MEKTTFGINGFGRIGRTALRVWWLYHKDTINLKAINTSGSMEIEDWVHLLKYDSNYKLFNAPISVTRTQNKAQVSDQNPVLGFITIGDKNSGIQKITITAQRDPAKIPWSDLEVEIVIEATGVFVTQNKASLHLQGGAKKVLISAPAKGEGVKSAVIGVNELNLQAGQVGSNESCTTNCVAPVALIMHQTFNVKQAMLTTIHSFTDDQNVQDNSHKDLRRARTASTNIIPTTTGAAVATTRVVPELKGLFDGMAIRVPTPTGSLSDMVFVVEKPTSIQEVNETFQQASQQDRWRGILATTTDPIVSSDIIGRRESSIVDLSLTNVIGGTMVKVISWYDNEWGYCNRLVEQAIASGSSEFVG
jgi:glyceraldehyde 3-phosphate dehydrogenase